MSENQFTIKSVTPTLIEVEVKDLQASMNFNIGSYIKIPIQDKENDYDFRISILPTITGESIVIRILDNQKAFLGLQHIGFCEDVYKSIKKNIIFIHNLVPPFCVYVFFI